MQFSRSFVKASLAGCLSIALQAITAHAADPALLSPKPPLGWNSYDSYLIFLHEEAAMRNLEAMSEKLKPWGYDYFVIDGGWSAEHRLIPGSIYPADRHAKDVHLDEYGRNLPSKVYFPNGFKPLAKRARELGVKFGVHMMRGIPRKAVELNLPIKGTPYHAKDIANTDPAENCKWSISNYAVDMSKPGAQEWYDGLIAHLAEMEVDFIKYDDIVPHPDEVDAVVKAIKKCGRPIVLSLSPGGKVDPGALESFRGANALRVTHDIWDDEKGLDQCFDAWRKWSGKEQPGFWIDMDMIPFGELALMRPPAFKGPEGEEIALSGRGSQRRSCFSPDQMLTFITMRALAASPLMVGGDLLSMDSFSLRLLTDPDMLACNQNGVMGHLVHEQGKVEIWLTPQRERQSAGWVGVFNRGWQDASLVLSPELLGLTKFSPALVRDIWNGSRTWTLKDTPQLPVTVKAGGVLFLRFETPEKKQPVAKRSPKRLPLPHK